MNGASTYIYKSFDMRVVFPSINKKKDNLNNANNKKSFVQTFGKKTGDEIFKYFSNLDL